MMTSPTVISMASLPVFLASSGTGALTSRGKVRSPVASRARAGELRDASRMGYHMRREMDYEAYRKATFTDPEPEPRQRFSGSFGVTLYFEAYEAAIGYYQQVLGPPAYVEGAGTRGWRIGSGWLTLLQGQTGGPQNVEVAFWMESVEEAETLQRAFIAAGGEGPAPSDQLMYVPIRSCPVRDPFGTDILIVSPLGKPVG